jgi:hypothetical protein
MESFRFEENSARRERLVTGAVTIPASAMDSSVLLGNLQLLEIWLGGLDSNQDNQIQNLMYCQLYDLPAERETTKKGRSHDPDLLY